MHEIQLSMKFSIEAPENEIAEPGEVHLHIRFRPASMTGLLLVVLMHAVLLYFLLHMQLEKKKKQGDNAASNTPMVLIMDKVVQAKQAAPKKSEPKAKPPVTIPKTRQTPNLPSPVPPVEAPAPIAQTLPPVAQAAPAEDMMAMLNAVRAKRQAQQDNTPQESSSSSNGRGMSPQEVAEANVRRSMQQATGREGTNGVFQILSKSTRVGTFSFRGWRPNSSSSWKQVIEVDAGLGGNVELAMVRRMIELIRSHYQGDFSWESRRLGKVITLSARPQDSAELENFLMKEFFG